MKKTLKTVVSLALSAVVATSTALSAGGDFYTLQQVNFPIYSNGYLIEEGDLPTLSLNGNTYVPLRKLAESASVDVNWNNDTGAIEVKNEFVDVYYFEKLLITEYLANRVYTAADAVIQAAVGYEQYTIYDTKLDTALKDFNELYPQMFPDGLYTGEEFGSRLNDIINKSLAYAGYAKEYQRYLAGMKKGTYTRDYIRNVFADLNEQSSNYYILDSESLIKPTLYAMIAKGY